ncbi:hypothetical protein, partial [Thermomonas haemolytica]|uniref:hypothetical protein n=1 Tax=Thermomonas haemolytica TaxID=141949 RepID=UPI001962BCCA
GSGRIFFVPVDTSGEMVTPILVSSSPLEAIRENNDCHEEKIEGDSADERPNESLLPPSDQ